MSSMMYRHVLVALIVGILSAPASGFSAEATQLFIDNGTLRLGVDLAAGGSIFYFAEAPTGTNLINHFDKGRFIQQSYYGDPDGSSWDGQPWRWNPVQGGGYRGSPAVLLEARHTATSLYTRSVPKHWASEADIEEAQMEQWITLNGETVHIRFGFSYAGERDHAPYQQELPAVYVDSAYAYLVFYAGSRPWTGDNLTKIVPQWPQDYANSDENWAAYVNRDGWGLGVYTPDSARLTFFRRAGTAGAPGSGCSYLAPLRTFAITSGLRFTYDVHLTIGDLEQIRRRFDLLRKERAASGS